MKELREQDIELIERVLSQTASGDEIASFNERVANEPEFAARVTLMKNIKANIKAQSDEFEDVLESIHESYQERGVTAEPNKQPAVKVYYYIAASLVLLLAVLYVFKGFNGRPPMERLYTSNFSVPPENITTRDSGGLDADLVAAVNAYRQRDFKRAILNFGAYLKTNPEDDAANFYIGVAYMADEQHSTSIKFLQRVINSRDSIYQSAAQWYLGLAYLKTDNIPEAIAIFSELSKSNSSYAKKAGRILNKLQEE